MTAGFGRVELSDPRHERDHLRFLTFQSPALGGRGDVALFVPPHSERLEDLPLVVLLHGVHGSHWAWALKGGAHQTAARLVAVGDVPPLVLAMPSDGLTAEGTGYLPHEGADYERWIAEDVVGCVTEALPQLSSSSARFVAGLSMGGWGALRLGAKHAVRFRGVSAHSSLTHLDALDALLTGAPTYRLEPGEGRSALHWLERHRDDLPPFRFDCGVDDRYIEDNRTLHRALVERGIPHVYEEFPGGHTWEYWAAHLEDTLRFFARLLRTPGKDRA